MSTLDSTSKIRLTPFRKILFSFVLLLFPIMIIGLTEAGLRIADYGKDFSLFIDHPDPDFKEYKIENPKIGAKYFQHLEYNSPTNDILLKEKKKNSFRIFVMGSSSVVGFPYEPNLMFPRILQSRLQMAYPDKQIEVFNTAITAVNSYTLLDFTDDILNEKPDAILIYAGHNEYYGAFGVGSNEGIGESRSIVLLHLKLMDFRIYQLIRNSITALTGKLKPSEIGKNPSTLMSRVVKNAEIAYGSAEFTLGLNQYKANMTHILEKAAKKNVPVFIGTLVSNIQDIKPFGTISSKSEGSADEYFSQAESAFNQGDFKSAKELYVKAKDFDCVRFRASSDINLAIETMAKENHAILVPILREFEENSPNTIIGNNLLTEHVHPNISGYFLLADGFFNSIVESQLINKETALFSNPSKALFRNSYGYTALDSLLGYHRIENLKYHWPYKKETEAYADYRVIYKPKDFIDSLAFKVMVSKDLAGLDAHLILAKKHISQSKQNEAYREYKAIIQLAPYNPELLREAGGFFISAGDLPLALQCFNNSLKYQNSYFANFRAGEICLIQNNNEQAARYFTEALTTADKDYQLKTLKKLYIAYAFQGKKAEANQVYRSILKLEPNSIVDIPARSYNFSFYIPCIISDRVKQAIILLEQKKTDEALKVLLECMEITDSPLVCRILTDIYIQKLQFENAFFYLGKTFPWFKYEPAYLIQMFRYNLAGNRYSQAKECLFQLKVIDPENQVIPEFERFLRGK